MGKIVIVAALVCVFVLPAMGARERTLQYELKDPLFEPLLGDVAGPERILYWSTICGDKHGRSQRWLPAHAKKFGHRFVFEEQLEETARYKLVPRGRTRPALRKHGVVTWLTASNRRGYGTPAGWLGDERPLLPNVTRGGGWIMDPRWLEQYVERAVANAVSNEQWSLCAGDEMWEGLAINVVPRDKWYKEVIAADEEIREKYGFGKYGMPASDEDADPFARIAHRRWVNDKLTETFRKTYEAVKKVNPDIVMHSPNFSSGVPAGDIEAWGPYFDIFTAQSDNSPLVPWPSPFVLRVGCDTKVLVDLAGGKPVWMNPHNAKEPDAGWTVTPEDVIERYSQIFRNGGHGIWLLASEWYERELSHPKYAEPAKWRAMLHVVDTVTHMNLPKLPEQADCAILYCSDSLLASRWGDIKHGSKWRIDSAYVVLGPMLRSWFHFVSDRQIERGSRDLNDYRVLYIPFAEYERAPVLDKIVEYVEAGGTVVCTDVDAFNWNINGESLSDKWTELTGVSKVRKREGSSTVTTVMPNPLPLAEQLSISSQIPAWEIVPADDKVKTLGKFDDGSPAITLHRYGKGKVIFFAADPFVSPGGWQAKIAVVAGGTPIERFFEAVQKDVGARMGHDIWRFKLPPFPGDVYQKEKGLCLTNNYVYDRNEPLLEPNNVQTGGTYTYSRPPTGIADATKGDEPIPFSEGHLTNRLKAWETRNPPASWDFHKLPETLRKWIVSWTDPPPISITFDLKSDYPLDRVRLFYSQTMPALKVRGSRDAETWQTLASTGEETARIGPLLERGDDVRDVRLSLEGTYRYVRLDFARRDGGEELQLCEVDIWGEQR